MELQEEISVKCNSHAEYDKLSIKLHKLGYKWGASGKSLIDKSMWRPTDNYFVFALKNSRKAVFNGNIKQDMLTVDECIQLLELNSIYREGNLVVDDLFKQIKIIPSFKKGNLVTGREKPFELVILVTKPTGRHSGQFSGVIIRFPESFSTTTQVGDIHDTFQYKDFELITDMELSLKVKIDEEN